jgi:hypothetical protein
MFTKKEVRHHLGTHKEIDGVKFVRAKRGRLKSPYPRIKGGRTHHTDILDAGGSYQVLFAWKDGAVRERRSFYCWLWLERPDGLAPIARLDYHPSHKDLHVNLNCEGVLDLINRDCVACKEFNLHSKGQLDPAQERDREALIRVAMECFGIKFITPAGNLL